MQRRLWFLIGVALACCAMPATARRGEGEFRSLTDRRFDPADYEEEAGSGFTVFSGPDDGIHGFGFNHGTWLKNAPVLGDFLLRAYDHGGERAYYSGIGMTLRLMPRWTFAPYIGGGGNYNYSIARRVEDTGASGRAQGDSYWSGHAETGVRVWIPRRMQYLEAAARQVWNHGPDDYTLLLFTFGRGPLPLR